MALNVESISFAYSNKPVLKNISVKINSGSLCAILGGNGSGKTTFIKCINKLLSPQSGRILLNDNDINQLSHNEVAKLVSYVPQEHDNILPYPVIEVVVMGVSPYLSVGQIPNAEHYQFARDVLSKLNARYLETKQFNQISGGERQIALIARALVQKSPIMLLDEPSNHLDFSRKSLLMNLLRNICSQENKTIVTTTHDPNLISSVADHVIMLKDGEVFCEGFTENVLQSNNISEIYDVDIETVRDDCGRNLFFAR